MSSVATPDPAGGALITGEQAQALVGKGIGALAKKVGLGKKKGKFFKDMGKSTMGYFAPKIRGAIKKVAPAAPAPAAMRRGGRVRKMKRGGVLPPRSKNGRFIKRRK